MKIRVFAAGACCLSMVYSCSLVPFKTTAQSRTVVVATEQAATSSTVKPAVGETRTLVIKSDEKDKVLVAGCVLKDSSSLSAFSVIVGSFAQPTSAVSLIDKLKKKSLSPYFVRNEKGLYRLVAGSYANKDDADFLVLKLDVSDVDAWVLAR